MTLAEAQKLIKFCEGRRIKHLSFGQFSVEFFPKEPEAMKLDPASLAKTLSDSMPPDSAMLFASSEDMDTENLIPQQRENNDMT